MGAIDPTPPKGGGLRNYDTEIFVSFVAGLFVGAVIVIVLVAIGA